MKKLIICLFVSLFFINCMFSQRSKTPPNYKLIIGRWQSTQDKNEIWEFSESYLKMTYADSITSDNKYGINDRCQNDQKTAVAENESYITTYDGFCYYILKLNAKELELSYVGRGNTLRFIRKSVHGASEKGETYWGRAKNLKVFFYSEPNMNSRKTTYIIKGDKVAISNMKSNKSFYHVSYTTKSGKEMIGYIKRTDIEIL